MGEGVKEDGGGYQASADWQAHSNHTHGNQVRGCRAAGPA